MLSGYQHEVSARQRLRLVRSHPCCVLPLQFFKIKLTAVGVWLLGLRLVCLLLALVLIACVEGRVCSSQWLSHTGCLLCICYRVHPGSAGAVALLCIALAACVAELPCRVMADAQRKSCWRSVRVVPPALDALPASGEEHTRF